MMRSLLRYARPHPRPSATPSPKIGEGDAFQLLNLKHNGGSAIRRPSRYARPHPRPSATPSPKIGEGDSFGGSANGKALAPAHVRIGMPSLTARHDSVRSDH